MPDNSTLCAKYRSRRRQGVGSSSFVEGNYEEDYEFEDEDQSDGTQQQTLIQRKNYQYHCHTNNDNGAFPRCFGDVAATRHVSLSAENEKSLLSKNYRLAKEFNELKVRHREESKSVTRLTMENMNLAARLREAMGQVAALQRELVMQQKRGSDLNLKRDTMSGDIDTSRRQHERLTGTQSAIQHAKLSIFDNGTDSQLNHSSIKQSSSAVNLNSSFNSGENDWMNQTNMDLFRGIGMATHNCALEKIDEVANTYVVSFSKECSNEKSTSERKLFDPFPAFDTSTETKSQSCEKSRESIFGSFNAYGSETGIAFEAVAFGPSINQNSNALAANSARALSVTFDVPAFTVDPFSPITAHKSCIQNGQIDSLGRKSLIDTGFKSSLKLDSFTEVQQRAQSTPILLSPKINPTWNVGMPAIPPRVIKTKGTELARAQYDEVILCQNDGLLVSEEVLALGIDQAYSVPPNDPKESNPINLEGKRQQLTSSTEQGAKNQISMLETAYEAEKENILEHCSVNARAACKPSNKGRSSHQEILSHLDSFHHVPKRRSALKVVSYAEPSLNTKLRRGDKFYPNSDLMN